MKKINQLIAANKIQEAINLLVVNGVGDATSLQGRFSRLQKDSYTLMSGEQSQIEMNKIIHSLRYYADNIDHDTCLTCGHPENNHPFRHMFMSSKPNGLNVRGNSNVTVINSTNVVTGNISGLDSFTLGDGHAKAVPDDEQTLLTIMQESGRRRKPLADKAKKLLKKLRAYKDEKLINKSFDITKRRYKALLEKISELVDELHEAKDDSLENFAEKVNTFLTATIPNYKSLQAAFDICRAKGMKDDWIAEKLKEQFDDDDIKIEITERIETFTATVKVK